MTCLVFSLSASNVPVEFGAFDERICVSVSNEHFTVHAGEAFRVVLLLSSNLFKQGRRVITHRAEAQGIMLVNNNGFYKMTFSGVRL